MAVRVVERHNQVLLGVAASKPGVRRAILKQQHTRQRPTQPPLAVLATERRLLHQPGRLQSQPRHRVTVLIVVVADQSFVKMLHREVVVSLANQCVRFW